MGEDFEPRHIRNWTSLLYEVWRLAFGMEIQRVLWQLDDFFADVDSPEEPEEGRPRRRAQPAAGGSTVQLAAVPDNSVDYGGSGSPRTMNTVKQSPMGRPLAATTPPTVPR